MWNVDTLFELFQFCAILAYFGKYPFLNILSLPSVGGKEHIYRMHQYLIGVKIQFDPVAAPRLPLAKEGC